MAEDPNPNAQRQPRGGVAQPGDVGVSTADPAEAQRREAAKNEAAQIQAAEDAARRAEVQRDAERREAAESAVPVPEEPATQVGEGGVKLQYLGTSDEYDFGPASDEDPRSVVAVAGGGTVSVPRELAESVANLPHDKFKVVE